MEKVVLLTSSGLDSACLINFYLSKNYYIYPIYIKAGFKWEKAELFYLKKLLKKIKNKNISTLKIVKDESIRLKLDEESNFVEDSSVYIPFRNLSLILKGAIYAYTIGSKKVGIGIMGLINFPDNSKSFIKNINKMLNLYTDINIEAPFLGMHKKEVFEKFGLKEFVKLSFSCANPDGLKPCGKCTKCIERKEIDEKFL